MVDLKGEYDEARERFARKSKTTRYVVLGVIAFIALMAIGGWLGMYGG